MYRTDRLEYILAPQFHLPVLIGGIGVLVLVVRAVRSRSGRKPASMQAAD